MVRIISVYSKHRFIITAMCCGGFILRYGSVRISQWALLMMGGSLFIVSVQVLWLYPIAAILLGLGGVLTPASSHLLAKVCPPKIAALIFSIKQTGVPLGSLVGGLLIPLLLGVSVYVASSNFVSRGCFWSCIHNRSDSLYYSNRLAAS